VEVKLALDGSPPRRKYSDYKPMRKAREINSSRFQKNRMLQDSIPSWLEELYTRDLFIEKDKIKKQYNKSPWHPLVVSSRTWVRQRRNFTDPCDLSVFGAQ